MAADLRERLGASCRAKMCWGLRIPRESSLPRTPLPSVHSPEEKVVAGPQPVASGFGLGWGLACSIGSALP